MLGTCIGTSFIQSGFTADEPPIPFLSEVAGKYTGTVKIINWGPDSGAPDNDFWGIVTALREAKGQSFPTAFEVIAETRAKGKIVWRGEEDIETQIPFIYEPVGGRITLDAALPKLPGVRAKVDCAATMVPRGDRYTVQLAGSVYLVSEKGEKDGWINIGVKATSKDVLERATPPKPAPLPAYKPSETKRRDSGSRFSDLSGQVEVYHYDYQKQDWDENGDVCKMYMVLYADDKIVTGEESEAVVSFSDMTTFHMRAESAIILDTPPEKSSKITLLMGNILVNIKKMITDGTMETHMSQAVLGIKGTMFVCRETGASSEVSVLEGVVEMRHRATGKVQSLRAGQVLVATTNGFSPISEFDVGKESAKWPESSKSRTAPKGISPSTPTPAESPIAGSARPAPKPLNGPYVHPSGEYQFTATQGWGRIPNYRNLVADPDAETLLDDSQQIAISMMKHVNQVSSPKTAFARWLGMVSRSLDQPGLRRGLRIDNLQFGAGTGWRISYRLDQPLVINRIFLTHNGRWYILNVIAPLEFGLVELPRPVVDLFNSIEFLSPAVPATLPPLGAQRLKVATLDQLSNDFGLIAYEHGVVIQDKVHGVEQLIRAGTESFHMQDNTANLLKGDTVMLQALGQARTAPIGVFDYRFDVQFFDGGVAIHDPVSAVVWVKSFD